jgi:hypothetical protein
MSEAVNFSQLKIDKELLIGQKVKHFSKCYKVKTRARGFHTLVNRISLDLRREIDLITFEEDI